MDQPKLGLVKEAEPPEMPEDEEDGWCDGGLLIDRKDLDGEDVEEVEEEDEDENVRSEEYGGRGWEPAGGDGEDYEEAGASEGEEEEEDDSMKAFDFSACPECKEECPRPVKELCGHVKCRDCFIGSGDGCMQCVKAGSHSFAGMDNEESEEVLFFDENDEDADEGREESEGESHLENGELIVKPNEYVFELDEISGSKSLAVVSKETLIDLGINPDGNELHQKQRKNSQPNNKAVSSVAAEVIVPDINLPNSGTNIPPPTYVETEPENYDAEGEPPLLSPQTQLPSQNVPMPSTNTNTKEKIRRGKRHPRKAMKTDHIIEIDVVDPHPSPIIGPGFDQPLKQWKCLICDEEFKQDYRRKYHYYCDTSNGKRPFACEHCSEEFISQSHYLYHVRSKHTGEKPYECPICNHRFIQKVKLNRHMTTHGSKPKPSIDATYLCAYCKKRFSSLAGCKRHIKLHTEQSDDKPFECDICQKAFHRKASLQLHRAIHTKERPHKCPECDKRFHAAKDMRRHHLIHTGECPFECAVCNIKFRRKDNLERHIRTTHNLSGKIAKAFSKEAAREYQKKRKVQETRNNTDS